METLQLVPFDARLQAEDEGHRWCVGGVSHFFGEVSGTMI